MRFSISLLLLILSSLLHANDEPYPLPITRGGVTHTMIAYNFWSGEYVKPVIHIQPNHHNGGKILGYTSLRKPTKKKSCSIKSGIYHPRSKDKNSLLDFYTIAPRVRYVAQSNMTIDSQIVLNGKHTDSLKVKKGDEFKNEVYLAEAHCSYMFNDKVKLVTPCTNMRRKQLQRIEHPSHHSEQWLHLSCKEGYNVFVQDSDLLSQSNISEGEIVEYGKVTKKSPESPPEGIDVFVEEFLWASHKTPHPSYKELEGTPSGKVGISHPKKIFSVYSGDLFQIIHPKSFKARPLKPTKRFDVNYHKNEVLRIKPKLSSKYFEYVNTDKAYFTSPDGLVEFFVYAKDISNDQSNYTKIAKNEIKIRSYSDKFFFEKKYLNYILKYWATVKEKNNIYYRSYIYQRSCHDDNRSSFNDCETQVIGIKYKNVEAYIKYRDLFIVFNNSLSRSADF